jgi:hypothetical protein
VAVFAMEQEQPAPFDSPNRSQAEDVGGAAAFALDAVVMTGKEVARGVSGRLGIGEINVIGTGHLAQKVAPFAAGHEFGKSEERIIGRRPLDSSVRDADRLIAILETGARLRVDRIVQRLALIGGHAGAGRTVEFSIAAAGGEHLPPVLSRAKHSMDLPGCFAGEKAWYVDNPSLAEDFGQRCRIQILVQPEHATSLSSACNAPLTCGKWSRR